jgi:hypothetical protein
MANNTIIMSEKEDPAQSFDTTTRNAVHSRAPTGAPMGNVANWTRAPPDIFHKRVDQLGESWSSLQSFRFNKMPPPPMSPSVQVQLGSDR